MRSKARFVIAGALLQLVGCSSVPDAINPVSWYRGITGASKNDELGSGQNEQNLKEGSSEPYPNLGNVPEAPDTALSSVDRDKLVNSLIADRNNAKYSADDLRAGRTSGVAPPPPPAPASPSPSAASSAAQPSASPPAPAQAAAPAPPAPAPTPPTPPPTTTAQAAAPASPAATPSQTRQAAAPQQRAPARGSEAPPAESPVASPTVKSVPQGEAVTPAPPPPQIGSPAASNRVASAAPTTRLTPPNATAKPAAAPAATPTPPTGTHRAGVSYRVADVAFAPGSALLASKLRDTIAQIVKLHAENGGTIRIVGHGEATGANAAVTGLTLALDRAQAVAVALTDSGVAAKDIAIEAAPVAGRGGNDVPRAEVYLEN